MTLPITDLFTPAPSGVGSAVAPAGSWLDKELQVAAVVELPVTAWQPGGNARTLLALIAEGYAETDVLVSAFAQAGFLQWAATGTITFTNLDGTTITKPVTPDPSDSAANPTGALGWLDALGQQLYDTARVAQTYAAGQLYLVNTSAGAIGPLAPSQFHVAATTATRPTYSNVPTLTLTPSTSMNVTAGSVSGTTVSLTLSSVAGLAAGSVLFVGVLSAAALTGVDNTFQKLLSVNPVSKVVTFTDAAAAGTLSGTVTAGAYLTTAATFQADFAGTSGTAAPGDITQVVTAYPGVFCDNMDSFVGGNWESNTAYAARCLLKLQSISPGGAAGAYAYVALSALNLYADAAIPFSGNVAGTVALTEAITKVLVASNTATGAVNVTVANATGAVTGLVQAAISAASNTSPIVLTVASTTGVISGDTVYVSGVEGNPAANGYWQLGTVTPTTLELVGSVGSGAYTSGGTVEGGDLGLLDLLLQERVVGQACTETTASASASAVNIAATVTVPSAQASTYQSAAGVALTTFLASFPVGGWNGLLPISAIEGVLYAAGATSVSVSGAGGSYVQRVDSLTLDGVAADLAVGAAVDLTLGTLTLTVVGV